MAFLFLCGAAVHHISLVVENTGNLNLKGMFSLSIKFLPTDLCGVSLQNVAGGDVALLIEASRPVYAYENNKRTDTIEGYQTTLVAVGNKYKRFCVKTATPVAKQEQLDAAKDGVLKVRIKGFQGRFYHSSRDDDYILTATAEAIEVLGN